MTDEKKREPFRSSVTNFDDIRKRMDELGIRRPIGTDSGVDVAPKPDEPFPFEPGRYYEGAHSVGYSPGYKHDEQQS